MTIPILAIVSILWSVSQPGLHNKQEHSTPNQMDPHSFADHNEVVVRHITLDLTIDFEKRELRGSARLHIDNKAGAGRLTLDTRNLSIASVSIDGKPANFSLGESVPHFGQALTIDMPPTATLVLIHYSTSPDAAALQWLDPEQTAGRKHPFLFTQSQAILARTWVPCQDNPAVRMTYDATIRVPQGMLAVMSARNDTSKNPDGVYRFTMPQPIPSYLLALAVGDIEFRPLGKRSGVYAEPSIVETAAWEFADTEKMMDVAERLYGPYQWERYDIIVLPPSFPFGGMENPRLTFATPTILAGDRSLVSLVAHELAHSWSGNLVTNASWGDFWLNEGFTTYFERRILESVYGRDYSEMQALLGYQDLQNTLTELGHDSSDTRLYLDLTGRDPDDGMTDIPYEKGYFLLRLIEESVGRERWDLFLREYFKAHAFQSMTTSRFLALLRDGLFKDEPKLAEKLNLDAWVYKTGLPDNCPQVSSRAFREVEKQVDDWRSGKPTRGLRTRGWVTQEWMHFLRKLPARMASGQMKQLDETFALTASGNSEVLHEWFLHVIANKYEHAYPALERFLITVGRRKFLKPLYTKMAETEEGMEMARRIYAKARPGYHAVSVRTIDEILKWNL